jgi:hypothetical protein
MANNLIQVKRTSVSGRAANTTTLPNAGELALNMTDGILYSTNGSVVFEIGANTTNSRVTGNLTIKGIIANGSLGTGGQVLKSNGSVTYWGTDGADVGAAGQVLYRDSSNVLTTSSGLQYDGVSIKVNGNLESVYQNGSEGGEIFLSKPASGTTLSGTGVTLDIFENKLRIFENGGSNRGAYIDLTTATGGVGTNLLSSGGSGSVNTSAQYTWTNTQIFQANVAFTGNNITVVSNTGSVMFGGAGDTNWRIGRSTGSFNKLFYTNNTLDFIAANSNLEGIAFGFTGNSVYLETGYNGTYTKNPVYIGTINSTSNGIALSTTSLTVGNSSVNATINSTSFSGTSNNALTANNSTNLGGTAAASYVQNTDTRTLSGNLIFSGANVVFSGRARFSGGVVANNSLGTAGQILASNGTSVYWTSDQGANAVTANSLSANFISVSTGTITVGNSTVNTDIGNNYISVGNSTSYANMYSTFIRIGNSSVTSTINSTSFNIGTNLTANTTRMIYGSTTSLTGLGTSDTLIISGVGANATLGFAKTDVPSSTQSIGGIDFYANSGSTLALGGTINFRANENWSAVAQGTDIQFRTVATGTTTLSEVARITSSGAVNAASHTIGTTFVANTTAVYFGTINSTSNGVVVNATSFVVGNSSVSATINSTAFSGTANNATNLGGTAAANFVQNTDSRTLSGNLNFTGANLTVTANLTIASTGELIITSGAGIYANGTLGTANQVLTTNGTTVYWANSAGGGGGFTNGQSISVNNFVLTGAFSANSSNGTAGQFLTSGGSSAYWSNAAVITVYYANGSVAFSGTGSAGGSGGGATGGGGDQVFYENNITITGDYTISTNKNAMTAGPVSINSGVTVTVPSGSVWTIV